jgi:amino acid adenylation domain-containing protein
MMGILAPSLIVSVGVDTAEVRGIYPGHSERPLVVLDGRELEPGSGPDLTNAKPCAGELAYFLFTSGTTGTPKCVKTRHAPLIHFVGWYARRFQPRPGDRFSMLSGLGHDPILRDVFVPLSVGAEICIPSPKITVHPARLFEWVQTNRISFQHATPQLLKVMTAGAGQGEVLPRLRYVVSGGDALRVSHVAALKRVAPDCEVVNFYGATETPQAMGYHVVASSDIKDPIPAGRGIDDVRLLVLRDDGQECHAGETGQIGIRTKYLSDGYLNDDGLTRQKFIKPTNGTPADEALYLTGDLGIYRDDGAVVVQGRSDDQVKIRGFRIELGEVERAIADAPGVRDVVVLASKDCDSENRLHAFLVPEKGTPGSNCANDIRDNLQKRLPVYMVPTDFVCLDRIPLLPTGKVDRQRLLSLVQDHIGDIVEEDEESAVRHDSSLTRELRSILRVTKLDETKSFIDHGGDSLSCIRAAMVIEKALGWLPENWEKQPIEALLAQRRKNTKIAIGSVGTPILARAIGIVIVLLAHFCILLGFGVAANDGLGATTLLFVIAGWSIGKYQLNSVLKEDRVAPFLKTALSLTIPAAIFNVFVMLRQSHAIDLPTLLMIHTYFTPSTDGGYWFINVLVHTYLIFAIVLTSSAVRKWLRRNVFRYSAIGTIVFLAFAAVARVWQHGNPIKTPFQQLWLILLGIAIADADTTQKKLLVAAFALMLGREAPDSISFSFTPVALTLLVIFVKRVKLPMLAAQVVNLTAGASLFIYLSHRLVRDWVGYFLPIAARPKPAVICCIVVGVLLWKLWDSIYNPLYLAIARHLTGRESVKGQNAFLSG